MPSDRARVSYDPTRQYRSVVAQQGRVQLEADWNEAQTIAAEELRERILDVVGSIGTPDDGYRVLEEVVPDHPFDFEVMEGTMYVGGERVFLPERVRYGDQEEWLDRAGDPLWVTPGTAWRQESQYGADQTVQQTPEQDNQKQKQDNQREFVYLFLREQEVSAVEDPALKDVALGGPDTTQRTRLIQRIVRRGTEQDNCYGALGEALEAWKKRGLEFDPETMRLKSAGELKVCFTQVVTVPDLCEPEARGGYLGADNQLIRIQISGVGQDGKPRIVWGFDNGYFMYRVIVESPDGQTLRLISRPVDDYHMPRVGQAVEVLRSAARLTDEDYIASATGVVFTLDDAYDPGDQTVRLPDPLPPEYEDDDETPVLFLRVWEREEVVTPGEPIELKTDKQSTGLQVILRADNDVFHVGANWEIAVRPNTPDKVYPRRYLKDFQPPDGPREWVCPLALIEWEQQYDEKEQDFSLSIVEDCRNPFCNLVELERCTGCCEEGRRLREELREKEPRPVSNALPEGERNMQERIARLESALERTERRAAEAVTAADSVRDLESRLRDVQDKVEQLIVAFEDASQRDVAEAEAPQPEALPTAPPPAETPQPESSEINATYPARSRAQELGVDLAEVEGTGPGGRITLEDVRRFYAREREGS
jgi:hypothetical protein